MKSLALGQKTKARHPVKTALGVMLIASLTFGGFVRSRSGANLVVTNGSDEEITQARVIVAGRMFELGTIAPGQEKKIKVRSYGDSSWKISGVWKNAERFEESVGYITNGASFDDRATVHRMGNIEHASTMWHFLPPL